MTFRTRITTKGRTTIPANIRAALQAGPGDMLAWDMVGANVARVRRIKPVDLQGFEAAQGTLDQWCFTSDEEAYRDL